MSRTKLVYYLLSFFLLLGMIGGLSGGGAVLASPQITSSLPNPQPAAGESLELSCRYPTLQDIAGNRFTFEVGLKWNGSQSQKFSMTATAPPKWTASIFDSTTMKQVSAISLEPGKAYPDTVLVDISPLSMPAPGNYVVTFEASSGNIKSTIELTAVVTAEYLFAFYTDSGRLNTQVTAGKESHLSLIVGNTGTADIQGIDLVSSKPSGWQVTFSPEEIDSLAAKRQTTVDLLIKTPQKVIAGDYMLTLTAASNQSPVSKVDIQIRVTVLAPSIWGWVGIVIVLAVIAGLAVMFRVSGRR